MDYYGVNDYRYYYLAHHGITGMRWGKRNGPPYPLSKAQSQAVKDSGKKRQTFAEKHAEKKRKKQEASAEAARAKKAEEEAKAAEEKEHYEENKQTALRSGSAKDVLKYKGDLENKQIVDALNRIKWEQELSKIASEESDRARMKRKADRVFRMIGDATKYANAVYGAASTYQKFEKMIAERAKKAG